MKTARAPSCGQSSASLQASAWQRPPKGSRRSSNLSKFECWAAPKCRATFSARRDPPRRYFGCSCRALKWRSTQLSTPIRNYGDVFFVMILGGETVRLLVEFSEKAVEVTASEGPLEGLGGLL